MSARILALAVVSLLLSGCCTGMGGIWGNDEPPLIEGFIGCG